MMDRRGVVRGLAAAVGMASLSGRRREAEMGLATSRDRSKEGGVIALPKPTLTGRMTLEETIARRRSVREFATQPLDLAAVGQLLWAGSGITGGAAYFRSHPSAGALHPLELYLVSAEGIFHYRPRDHALVMTRPGDQRAGLARAALGQSFVAEAGCVIAIAAVYARTTIKYGERGRTRYVPMDAAHAAQNILLQAVGLGLGAVPVGAFEDEAVRRSLGLPAEEVPLYLIPVGKPRA